MELLVNVEGQERVKKLLGTIASEEVLDSVLQSVAEKLRTLVIGRSPIYNPQFGEQVKHEPGFLKSSWTAPQRKQPGLWSFQSVADYASVLEYGLYPKRMVVPVRRDGTPGRLIEMEGGIYSKQAPGGIVSPILNNQPLRSSIDALVATRYLEEVTKRMAENG